MANAQNTLILPAPGEELFTLAYPALIRARVPMVKGQRNENAVPRWEASFRIAPQHPAVTRIKQAIDQAATSDPQTAGYCNQRDQNGFIQFPLGFSVPLIWGDDYANSSPNSKAAQAFRGFWKFGAHANSKSFKGDDRKPPALTVVVNGEGINLPFDDTRAQYEATHFYGGAQVGCTVNLAAFKNGTGVGVTAYLNVVFSTGMGERVADLCLSDGADGARQFAQHIGTMHPQGSPYGQQPAGNFAPPR